MKDAHRKLLDLLAGWSGAADIVSEQESETVGDLYEEAGQFKDMTDEQIKEFVNGKILPFLLRDS
jgi:hypothetical protein